MNDYVSMASLVIGGLALFLLGMKYMSKGCKVLQAPVSEK